ncbi:MAG: hypothetical protein IJM54_07995, partial [Thermoguttaceae bacterium]|nr:hypothetical protein [Thermoguttaceae bacterium]
ISRFPGATQSSSVVAKAVRASEQFGKGAKETLKSVRGFYLTYKDRKSETVFHFFALEKS